MSLLALLTVVAGSHVWPRLQRVSIGTWRGLNVQVISVEPRGSFPDWTKVGAWVQFYRPGQKETRPFRSYFVQTGYYSTCDRIRLATFGKLPLLALEVNGGQHEFVEVFRLDPRTLRPSSVSDPIIEGDTSRLAMGIVVERCPDQYIEGKPTTFRRRQENRAELIRRVWRYDFAADQFVAGKYLFK